MAYYVFVMCLRVTVTLLDVYITPAVKVSNFIEQMALEHFQSF